MVPVEYERREVSEDCNLAVLAGMQVVPLKPWMEPQEMALRAARQFVKLRAPSPAAALAVMCSYVAAHASFVLNNTAWRRLEGMRRDKLLLSRFNLQPTRGHFCN